MTLILRAKRVTLRPLRESDFEAWNEVRTRCGLWLTRWEPLPPEGYGDPNGRRLFISRCVSREQESRMGTAYAFGVFLGSRFVGEANLSAIQRGPVQSANIGYWVDMAEAGKGITPEACAAIFRFAFEELRLHRIQISIVPRNSASLRVVEKLGLRQEGVAERYIEINGIWEDHAIFAITREEWQAKRRFYMERFLI
ncbi:MAG: GNAT family protein [Actinomycetota bacterium]|nr:GNAT family protein [Actinomycetota bacterium]